MMEWKSFFSPESRRKAKAFLKDLDNLEARRVSYNYNLSLEPREVSYNCNLSLEPRAVIYHCNISLTKIQTEFVFIFFV